MCVTPWSKVQKNCPRPRPPPHAHLFTIGFCSLFFFVSHTELLFIVIQILINIIIIICTIIINTKKVRAGNLAD